MSPSDFKFLIDVVVLLIGIYCIILAQKASVGGLFGQGMTYILLGILILTVNHALDTVFLGNYLTTAGHTKDFLQPAIVHRIINLGGFIFMAIGFSQFAKTMSKG